MAMLNKLKLRLRTLFFKSKMEDELQAELQFHLEREVEENIARGMTPEEARLAALRSFGGVERVKEESRDVRGVRFLEEVWQDLRYGARTLAKQPGFTLVVVVTLALGIGANTAMFSFVDAALFKPLAYLDPERLVEVKEQLPDGRTIMPHIPSYQEWRARNQVFSHMSAIAPAIGGLNLTGRGIAERIRGSVVSANYFELIGSQPAMGRAFSDDEEHAGKEHVAILSNRCWKQRFGADPNALGSKITLNNESYTVIGVLPPHPIFDRYSTEIWLPLVFTPEQIRGQSSFFSVMARLKPGVSIDQADAE